MLAIMEQRIAQEEEQTLFHEVYMRLGLKQQSDAIMQTGLRMQRAANDAPTEEISIEAAYDRAGGALLILGEPGAGKSTQLTKLAKVLVARAQTDTEEPIPVVFNLSSWAQRRFPLEQWLVGELRTYYGFTRKVAEDWLVRDELLLLLDGLDEVIAQHRVACVKAINAYRMADDRVRGPFPVVVCSRSNEYQALDIHLRLDDAVSVEPLNDGQIHAYFDELSASPDASGLTNTYSMLARDPELMEEARTPLMLNIILLAHTKGRIRESTQPNHRGDIFNAYIRRMFRHRQSQNSHYTARKTMEWLRWLAWRLQATELQIFMLERLHPLWLPARIDLWMFTFGVGIVLGLFIGSALILFISLINGVPADLSDALVLALGLSLYIGSTMGVFWRIITNMIKSFNYELYVEWPVWEKRITWWLFRFATGPGSTIDRLNFTTLTKPSTWIGGLISGLFGALAMGVALGLMGLWVDGAGLGFELIDGIKSGLILGFVLAVVAYLSSVMKEELPSIAKQHPTHSIHQTARYALLFGIIVALVSIPLLLTIEPQWALAFGLMAGLIVLLITGYIFIAHYMLRLVLASRNYLPFRLIRFLNYATGLIFLRRVGGGYRFTHRLLMDHIAALSDAEIEALTRDLS